MNAAEHAAAAEKLLAAVMAEDQAPCADDSTRIVANAITAAQVHATLAQVDYLREISDQLYGWRLDYLREIGDELIKLPRNSCGEVDQFGQSCILAAGHPMPHRLGRGGS